MIPQVLVFGPGRLVEKYVPAAAACLWICTLELGIFCMQISLLSEPSFLKNPLHALKKPWHIWVILWKIKVLGFSTWKHSTAHLTLPIFSNPVLWKFGHMSCRECIVSSFLVPRCIVEAKSCHSSSREVIFKELNSFFSLCTQICAVKVAISVLPSLEYDTSLLGSGTPVSSVLDR